MATELCEMDHGIAAPMQSVCRGNSSSELPAVHTLAVIVPVYNEQATVAELLRRLEQQSVVSQIIIVNDGSTDNTREELATWQANRAAVNPAVILHHEANRGKGRAIRTGLEHVTCSHVLIQDADLEYDPRDIDSLLEVVRTGQADVAYGSRYLAKPKLTSGRFVLQSGIRFNNVLCRVLYGIRLTDEATCYKLFRRDDLRRMNLTCEKFEFCSEVTAKCCRLKLRIRESPVGYNSRSRSAGRKLNLLDGVNAVLTLFRLRHWCEGRT